MFGSRDGQVPEARLQSGRALGSTAMHPGDLGKSEQQDSSLASPKLLVRRCTKAQDETAGRLKNNWAAEAW